MFQRLVDDSDRSWPIWDSGMAWGKIQQQRALLSEQEITYDDDVRQVELEIQQGRFEFVAEPRVNSGDAKKSGDS